MAWCCGPGEGYGVVGGFWRRLIAGDDLTRNTVSTRQICKSVPAAAMWRSVVVDERKAAAFTAPALPVGATSSGSTVEKDSDLAQGDVRPITSEVATAMTP